MMFALKLIASVPLVSGICACLFALLLNSETAAEQRAYGEAYDRRDREIDEHLNRMGPSPKGNWQ